VTFDVLEQVVVRVDERIVAAGATTLGSTARGVIDVVLGAVTEDE